jgi:hypothetical protein
MPVEDVELVDPRARGGETAVVPDDIIDLDRAGGDRSSPTGQTTATL